MTNRNRKQEIKSAKKKGLLGSVSVETASLIISLLALISSIISIMVSAIYSNKEYEYKLDPEITATTEIGIQIEQQDSNRTARARSEGIEVTILQKNNLQAAYLIDPDYEVEKLEINEAEDILETRMKEKIQMGIPDLSVGGVDYQYTYLLLKGLDGTCELYLIYARSEEGIFTFNGVSEVEVLGLAEAHANEETYEGEREMAKQYKEILEGCREYMFSI